MVVPSLVPYDFVNVGIGAEAFHSEGVGILGAVEEGRVTAEDPNCLYRPVFCLLDLMLNERRAASLYRLKCYYRKGKISSLQK